MKKIALIDLNHMTLGVHTNTTPLGITMIAYYLKNNLKHKFEIKIFKNPLKCLKVLENWHPDILGITQYAWNSELNLYVARLVKKSNPNCLVIAGGPNLYLSQEEKELYLKEHSFIDLCVSYDGEIPFLEIVRRFTNGEKIKKIRNYPPAGTYSLNSETGNLTESNESPPRLNSLDVFGSMYAKGFFDELLEEGFHPFLQTQRGCPFRCIYCHTGNDYCSKVIFQSAENFRQDMEYLGKRFAGRHNINLYLANTNFGLFKEDFEIARIIRHIQDKYDWPKNIDVNSGNNLDKLLEILSILKYKFMPAVALQTLTPQVLNRIKRKNIPFKNFVNFQKKIVQNISQNTSTELILSLPEETKRSFLATVSRVLNSGVQNIVIYTLMSLRGTLIASREFIQKHGHILRYRLVPRCFSEINGKKIFEIEEVVIGTKTMPFKDYLDLRGLAFIITTFASSIEMFPLRKFLIDCDVNIAHWVFRIKRRIPFFSNLYSVYKSFLQETKNELLSSRQELISFFSKQENYDLLSKGHFGDNLLRKYKAIILSKHYKECLDMAFCEAQQILKKDPNLRLKTFNSFMNDLYLYLKSRDIGNIFKDGYKQTAQEKVILNYDVPRWIEQENKASSLENYKGKHSYSIIITDYMHRRLKDFRKLNRNPELSLQIIYRDGYTKDYWPLWLRNE